MQDKFSFTKEDKNFPLKRLRAKRAPREREFFFFLRAGKLILPDRPCRIAIPKSYSIASSKDANMGKRRVLNINQGELFGPRAENLS